MDKDESLWPEDPDETGDADPEDEQPEKKPKKKRRGLLIAVLVLLVLLALALALAVDRGLIGGETSDESAMSDFTYENGSDQTYAAAGNGLAVASVSGVQLLDGSGDTIFRETCSMDSPAVCASESRAVFYDVGGSTCITADFDGGSTELDAGDSVISASVGESGYFVVISEESGSKGLVCVYNGSCELLYKWYSGTGYPLKAALSPDNTKLAVLCADSSGSVIHLFRLKSEEELASVEYSDELLFDLCFMSDSELAAIGSDSVRFANTDGEAVGSYDFGGRYLSAYTLEGSDFVALLLSEYSTGTGGELITLGPDGGVLGSDNIESSVISLSATGKRLLLAATEGLSLYSDSLELLEQEELLVTARRAILRPRGDVLLLSLYGAELFSF